MLKKYSLATLLIIILFTAFYFILTSFPSDEDPFSFKSDEYLTEEPDLINTSWSWQKTLIDQDNYLEPKEAGQFVLTFQSDNSFGSTTDCNNMGGEYNIDDYSLSFNNIFQTLMYCEGSLESVYLEHLSHAESYFIENQELTIITSLDSIMYFSAE